MDLAEGGRARLPPRLPLFAAGQLSRCDTVQLRSEEEWEEEQWEVNVSEAMELEEDRSSDGTFKVTSPVDQEEQAGEEEHVDELAAQKRPDKKSRPSEVDSTQSSRQEAEFF